MLLKCPNKLIIFFDALGKFFLPPPKMGSYFKGKIELNSEKCKISIQYWNMDPIYQKNIYISSPFEPHSN